MHYIREKNHIACHTQISSSVILLVRFFTICRRMVLKIKKKLGKKVTLTCAADVIECHFNKNPICMTIFEYFLVESLSHTRKRCTFIHIQN